MAEGLWRRIKRFFSSSKKIREKAKIEPFNFDRVTSRSSHSIISPIKSASDDFIAINKQSPQEGERERRIRQFRADQATMISNQYPLHPGFAGKYTLKCLLGEGSFAFVMLAVRLIDNAQVAVKFALREKVGEWCWDDGFNAAVPREVVLLSRMSDCHDPNHQGIIRLTDYASDPRYVYMVTELFGVPWTTYRTGDQSMKGYRMERSPGDLFECIEAHAFIPEPTIKFIFTQLVASVLHLYDSHQIVHRDLKDENVVIDDEYRIKLIDFGSASIVRGLTAEGGKFHGTMAFAAPEVVRGSTSPGGWAALPAEAWSLGVLLFTMAHRRAPFADAWGILHTDPPLPLDDPSKPPGINDDELISKGVYDLLKRLLQKDPSRRIPLHEVPNHPWMRASH